MGYTIRDVRTHALLVDTVYGQKSSAKRSYSSRLYTPETAYIADEEWRARESSRPNLINLEQFGLHNVADHFLHVSAKSTYEDFLVSYTENETKGRMDRQTPGRKIGRYLTEFHGLTGEHLNRLTHEISAAINKLPVDFAVTPDEIAAIYEECHKTSGMNSCMTYPRSQWGFRGEDDNIHHPVEAYGAGDLQLAYLRVNGSIRARVLVWPEKKFWNRFYGPDASKLQSILDKAGYKKGSFQDARLLSIKIPAISKSSQMSFVAPYIDLDGYVYLDKDNVIRIHNQPFQRKPQRACLFFPSINSKSCLYERQALIICALSTFKDNKSINLDSLNSGRSQGGCGSKVFIISHGSIFLSLTSYCAVMLLANCHCRKAFADTPLIQFCRSTDFYFSTIHGEQLDYRQQWLLCVLPHC